MKLGYEKPPYVMAFDHRSSELALSAEIGPFPEYLPIQVLQNADGNVCYCR